MGKNRTHRASPNPKGRPHTTTETLAEPASGADRADAAGDVSLLSELKRMAGIIARSRERKQMRLLVVGLIVIVAGTAYMQTRLNAWNQPFYDALSMYSRSRF
jgi:putative ATP-binding cassette transporter